MKTWNLNSTIMFRLGNIVDDLKENIPVSVSFDPGKPFYVRVVDYS